MPAAESLRSAANLCVRAADEGASASGRIQALIAKVTEIAAELDAIHGEITGQITAAGSIVVGGVEPALLEAHSALGLAEEKREAASAGYLNASTGLDACAQVANDIAG